MAAASGQNDVKNLEYFHTQFSNVDEVCRYMVANHFTEGQYLLRPSCSNKNRLAISVVVAGGKVCHMNVKYDLSGFYLTPERKFRSLEALFQHYSHNDINNTEKVNNVRLLNPIPCVKRKPVMHSRRSEPNVRGTRDCGASTHSSSGASGTAMKQRSHSESAALCDPREPYLVPLVPSPQTTQHTPAAAASSATQPPPSGRRHPSTMLNRPLPQPPQIDDPADKPPDYSLPQTFDRNHGTAKLNFVAPKKENLCKCGLPADIVELPCGWTVHLSNRDEVHSMQCLFFQSSYNDTTWVLPPEVVSLLNDTQREVLKQLAHNYGYAKENTCFA